MISKVLKFQIFQIRKIEATLSFITQLADSNLIWNEHFRPTLKNGNGKYRHVLMMDNDEYASPKAQYSKISYSKRLRLIELVENKNYSIYKASKQLAISNSTAKLIIKNYRQSGRIFQKKQEKDQLKKKDMSTPTSHEKDETIIKRESIESAEVKIEPSSYDFSKLLLQITQINLEWLRLQCQTFERRLQ